MSKVAKEYKRKMEVRKTLQSLRRHVMELNRQKEMYISKAKEARTKGITASYNIARSGLKTTMLQLKKTEEMLLNIELISQYKDFASISGSFVKNVQGISKELQKEVGKMNFAKAEKLFDSAMNATDMANSQMDMMLNNSADSFASMSQNAGVSDNEIDALIGNEVIDDEKAIDDRIESMLRGSKGESQKKNLQAMTNDDVPTSRVQKVEDDTPLEQSVPKKEIPTPVKETPKVVKEEPVQMAEFILNRIENYQIPDISLLDDYLEDGENRLKNQEEMEQDARKILETLISFNIKADVTNSVVGPLYTLHEVTPAVGQKMNEIASLEDNFKMALKKNVSLQIPLPGKNAFGIAVANAYTTTTGLKSALEQMEVDDEVKVIFGLDIDNKLVCESLYKLPHMLIGGCTGSGKSVFLHSLLTGLLLNYGPDQLRLLLIDMKRVEFNAYNGLPQLLTPKAIDNDVDAIQALDNLIKLMNKNYEKFEQLGVRNIQEYNEKHPEDKIPYVLAIIDEFADLIVSNSNSVFVRQVLTLAQKARASGIHLIIATQRPSVDIIKGTVKANFPTQIAFKTANMVDSRTIIGDSCGASLFGKGDMFLCLPFASGLQRVQAPYISHEEVRRIVKTITNK